MLDISWRTSLSPADSDALIGLLSSAAAEDGRPNFDPAAGLPGDFRRGEYGLATEAGALVGIAVRNVHGDSFCRQVAELIVRPTDRCRGVGTALLRSLLERVGPHGEDGETLRVWSHGDHPAAIVLADRFGLRRVRELRRMRMSFADTALPDRPLPDGVTLRTLRVGVDEAEVVAVNRRAFAWHPEQGALTEADLVEAEAESWFDPDGFFLAVDAADGRLLGFHWTKVHEELDGAGAPMGEVYVVGVDPDAGGRGLGTVLTLAGLRHLAARGCRQVMLYVESDNAPAIAVYSRLGFRQWESDVQYAY